MNNKLQVLLLVSISANLLLLSSIYATGQKLKSKTSGTDTVSIGQVPGGTGNAVKNTAPTDTQADNQKIFNEINPVDGFDLRIKYKKLGPEMIKTGVIDPEKFKAVFAKSGDGLTPQQEDILINGSDENIKITQDNSRFLLNFFWAAGLANKTKILTDGDMVKYGGQNELGNFASTGGWTLARGNAIQYYSKSVLISLTPKQEDLVNEVASNIYRPCCNNSTAFPDCNHGMALLGVLELMAANNRSEKEMYEAAKYLNAYWFPGSYYDLAVYFKNKENKNFTEIDPKIILSKEYSSATGSKNAKSWLINQGIVEEPPKGGNGCGV